MLEAHHYHYFLHTLIKENSITNIIIYIFYLRSTAVIGFDAFPSPSTLIANIDTDIWVEFEQCVFKLKTWLHI